MARGNLKADFRTDKAVSSLRLLNMTNRKQNCQNKRTSARPDVQRGSANWQIYFSRWGNAWKKLPFSGNIANKYQRPTILLLNIESLTANKMNVLYYLALQFEALVILLQKNTALMQKNLTSRLPTSWAFLMQEAWPCHVGSQSTKVYAFGPIFTNIGDLSSCAWTLVIII